MAVIAFSTHPDRPEAKELADRAGAWLRQHGHEPVSAVRPDGSIVVTDADLVVSLGGDGTMLRAVEAAVPQGVPVLGVNLGRLGYLTQEEPDGLEAALERFFAGDYQVEERMTMTVTLRELDGTVVARRTALNEASVEKTVPGHTVRIVASVDGRPFVTYAADGLIVSTPTGSTAYNLSARGPILSPRMRALIVNAVAPHMLFDRPLVLDPTETVLLTIEEPRPAVVAVDGMTVGRLEPGSSVECGEGERPARLVTFGSRDFHAILRAKFHLADR